MGELPEWYITVKAARLAGVPPWELAAQPLIWQSWIHAADIAELAARTERDAINERKAKRNRKN